jgi:hypothetical protein
MPIAHLRVNGNKKLIFIVKETIREYGVGYSGSESGQTWIKVESLRLCGGQASGRGKLTGSCEHGNERMVHKIR